MDVLKYTDEEYEKYLIDPVGTSYNKSLKFSIQFISVIFTPFVHS